jgi:hypothetical protein
VTVVSVLLVWWVTSILGTLALGRWLGRAGSTPLVGDDDLRVWR